MLTRERLEEIKRERDGGFSGFVDELIAHAEQTLPINTWKLPNMPARAYPPMLHLDEHGNASIVQERMGLDQISTRILAGMLSYSGWTGTDAEDKAQDAILYAKTLKSELDEEWKKTLK